MERLANENELKVHKEISYLIFITKGASYSKAPINVISCKNSFLISSESIEVCSLKFIDWQTCRNTLY